MTKFKSLNKFLKQRALYHALMKSILEDEDAMDEEETMFEAGDTQEPQNQEQYMGNTNDHPNVKAALKHGWPPQTWIIKIAQAEKPPLSFDELMSTPIDFSAYVMNHLKIDKLTQGHLVGPTFNLLKATCKSRKEYPFDLRKPLPLFMVQGRQVVHVDYFINNDLEYLWGRSSSKKYTNSTTKTKAAKYDIPGIKGMVLSRIVILKRVEDLQLGVKSYQKKLNITKPRTFKSDISNKTPCTAYNNPQRIIYVDKYNRNRLIRSDELYKFSDGTLTSVRTVIHDIASNLRMDYLSKRR
uniref:Uncharacterized protein n=1 Tax=Tanacetum cinerariifolium TaxID=118510 RepID=A0A6L2M9Q5_TANCI|nr:hypothetical protein [Tanacetum cinerariifolium]